MSANLHTFRSVHHKSGWSNFLRETQFVVYIFIVIDSGTIGDAGTSLHCFTLKGVVYVPISESKPLTKDEALEAAITTGAEDVVDGYDDYDRPAFQVTRSSRLLI